MIKKNHVHLWQIALNPEKISDIDTLLADCRKILSNDELERADRFIFEKHQRRFILAHFGLRKILGHYLSLLPEIIEFEVLSHGKPQIHAKQNKSLEFNLSHSGETALVGLRLEKPIGVDIEYHRDREFLGIADHVFSDLECQTLFSMEKTTSEEEQIQAFFHIWAQKEAFIKAIGQGLSYPLKDFSVSAFPPATLIETKHENRDDWYFYSFQPNSQAHAAIATLNPVDKISYFDFSYE